MSKPQTTSEVGSYSRIRAPSKILPPGAEAPDFRLRVTPDEDLSLSELRGRPVIVAFYPADWSPVCGDQMAIYNEVRPEFQKYGAEVLGISVDGAWCHKAFAEHRNIRFPLLSDFEPKGEVAKELRRLPVHGRRLRAGSVRDRQGWSGFLELTCRRLPSTPAPMAFSMLSKGCNRRSRSPPREGLRAEWSEGRRNAQKGELSWLL